jgi:hypothetical protein
VDLDLRLVRYFVTVADELHFGRAAAKLFISQPALSKQVRKLETQLGAQLLVRDSRHVTLTARGERFRTEGRELLLLAERMQRSDDPNTVRIGRVGHGCRSCLAARPRTCWPRPGSKWPVMAAACRPRKGPCWRSRSTPRRWCAVGRGGRCSRESGSATSRQPTGRCGWKQPSDTPGCGCWTQPFLSCRRWPGTSAATLGLTGSRG